MGPQVLVDPQRVERRGVEAGEEHVDHDHEVDLSPLESQRQILVVVLEPLGGGVEARAEQVVVVLDGVLEELPGIEAEPIGLELLLVEDVVDCLVRRVAVDEADLQPLIRR